MTLTVAISKRFGHIALGHPEGKALVRHQTISDVTNDLRTVAFSVREVRHEKTYKALRSAGDFCLYDDAAKKITEFPAGVSESDIAERIANDLWSDRVKLRLLDYTYVV